MSSEAKAAGIDNSSVHAGSSAEEQQTGGAKPQDVADKTSTTDSGKDGTADQGPGGVDTNRDPGAYVEGASFEEEPKSKPDDDEEDEDEEDEGEEDEGEEGEDAPQFTWGAPRGKLAAPVKGRPPPR